MLVFAAKNLNIHLTVLVFTFNALHGKKGFFEHYYECIENNNKTFAKRYISYEKTYPRFN